MKKSRTTALVGILALWLTSIGLAADGNRRAPTGHRPGTDPKGWSALVDWSGGRGPFTQPPRSVRSRSVDQQHLRLELDFNFERQEVRGQVIHTLTPFEPLRKVELDAAGMKIERVALVVLESQGVKGQALSFGPELKESGLRLVSFDGKDWRITSPAIVKFSGNDFLPSRELHIVPAGMKRDQHTVEGGLVLDEESRLVGIIRRGDSHPFSKKIKVWQVLPSEVVRSSVERIVETKRNIRAGWLGIMPDRHGSKLRVAKVISGSPAQKAGIRKGDVIARIDDQPVQHRRDLDQAIRWSGPGSKLNLSILRDDRLHGVSAILSERQDKGPMVSWRLEVSRLWNKNRRPEEQVKVYRTVLPPHLHLGLVVGPLTPQLAKYFRYSADQGLLIRSVLPDSPAAKVGFHVGDVLTQVNGRNVSSYIDIQESLQAVQDGVMVIQFVRNGHLMTRKVILP